MVAGPALLAFLCAAALPASLNAADFLFAWTASADLSVTAYGVYQQTGSSAFKLIKKVGVEELADPTKPSYLVTGLRDTTTYRFAATSFLSSNTESDFFSETCITVNGEIFQCFDDEDSNASVYISCFIETVGSEFFRRAARR